MTVTSGIFLLLVLVNVAIGDAAKLSRKQLLNAICLNICDTQRRCGTEKSRSCKSCRRKCLNMIASSDVENEVYVAVNDILALKGNDDKEAEQAKSLTQILEAKFTVWEKALIDAKAAKSARKKNMKIVCKEICTLQKHCAGRKGNQKTCTHCKDTCLSKVNKDSNELKLDEDFMTLFQEAYIKNKHKPTWKTLHVFELLQIITDKMQKTQQDKEVKSPLSWSTLCVSWCNLQNICSAVNSENCVACKSECLKQLRKSIQGLDKDTTAVFESLLTAISFEDEISSLGNSEISRQLNHLIFTMRGIKMTGTIEEKKDEQESDDTQGLDKLCKALCTSQNKCSEEDTYDCKMCLKECAMQFMEKVDTNAFDNDTLLMMERLLLELSTNSDNFTWTNPKVIILVKDLILKLSGIELENDEEIEAEEAPSAAENLCISWCEYQNQCLMKNSKNCETCMKECSEKLIKEINKSTFNEDAVLVLQRLTGSSHEGVTLKKGSELTGQLNDLILKLRGIEISESREKEKAELTPGIDKLCKTMCDYQDTCLAGNSDDCKVCKQECSIQLTEKIKTTAFDEDTQFMIERLITMISTSDDFTWTNTEITTLLKDLILKLSGIELAEDDDVDIAEVLEAPSAAEKLCLLWCESQNQCLIKTSEMCTTCKIECTKKLLKSIEDSNFDEDTALAFEKLLMILSLGQDEDLLESPDVSKVLNDLVFKLQNIEIGVDKDETGTIETTPPSWKKLCLSWCTYENKCSVTNIKPCETCKSKCLEQLKKAMEFHGLDKDSGAMFERLLQTILAHEDISLWEDLETSNQLKDRLFMIQGVKTSGKTNETKDVKKDEFVLGIEKLCKTQCSFQSGCLMVDSESCEICKNKCTMHSTEKIKNMAMDEDTRITMERLLMVLSTSSDDSIQTNSEVNDLIKDLLLKLRGIETEIDYKKEDESKMASDRAAGKLCKFWCGYQDSCLIETSNECVKCKLDCTDKLLASVKSTNLNDKSAEVFQRLILALSSNDNESPWYAQEISNLIRELLFTLRNIDVEEQEQIIEGKSDERSNMQFDKLCTVWCDIRDVCREPKSKGCIECMMTCSERLTERIEEIDLDEETKLTFQQLLLEISNSDDDRRLLEIPQLTNLLNKLIFQLGGILMGVERGHQTTNRDKTNEVNATISYKQTTTENPITQSTVGTTAATTTKPKPKGSPLKKCRVECKGRCLTRNDRSLALKSVSKKCRVCIKDKCVLYKIYNTNCAHDVMERSCNEYCPAVSEEVKMKNQDCEICKSECIQRVRIEARG